MMITGFLFIFLLKDKNFPETEQRGCSALAEKLLRKRLCIMIYHFIFVITNKMDFVL